MPAVYADVSCVAVTWLPVCYVDLGLDTAIDLKIQSRARLWRTSRTHSSKAVNTSITAATRPSDTSVGLVH